MAGLPTIIRDALTPEFRRQAEQANQVTLDDIQTRSPGFDAAAVLADPRVRGHFEGFLFKAHAMATTNGRYCSTSYDLLYGDFISKEPVIYRGYYNHAEYPTTGFDLIEFDTRMDRYVRVRDAIATVMADNGLIVGIRDDFVYDEPVENGLRIGRYAFLEASWA